MTTNLERGAWATITLGLLLWSNACGGDDFTTRGSDAGSGGGSSGADASAGKGSADSGKGGTSGTGNGGGKPDSSGGLVGAGQGGSGGAGVSGSSGSGNTGGNGSDCDSGIAGAPGLPPSCAGDAGFPIGPGFPAKFAAPFTEVWEEIPDRIPPAIATTQHKYYTLAFVLSAGNCTPAWDGKHLMSTNMFANRIAEVRAAGGDVMVSFGGVGGQELGSDLGCDTETRLRDAYHAVVAQYGLKAVDFNIEGGPEDDLKCNSGDYNDPSTCSGRVNFRNKAVKMLQDLNPNLRVSFTLSVMNTTGLPIQELRLVQNAKAHGVNIASVNISAMNYGPCGIDMGQAAIDAANQTIRQLNGVGLTTQNVGILPMLGVNDVSCETFTTQDAQQLVAWSNGNSRVAMLSFWALGRDTVNFDHLAIFKNFQ